MKVISVRRNFVRVYAGYDEARDYIILCTIKGAFIFSRQLVNVIREDIRLSY